LAFETGKDIVSPTEVNHPPSYVVCRQTHYIKPSAQIHKYDAEDVFELLNSRDQDITLNNLLEIRKQSTL
jgi:hypothetical protein